jgi:hypothetical protein
MLDEVMLQSLDKPRFGARESLEGLDDLVGRHRIDVVFAHGQLGVLCESSPTDWFLGHGASFGAGFSAG